MATSRRTTATVCSVEIATALATATLSAPAAIATILAPPTIAATLLAPPTIAATRLAIFLAIFLAMELLALGSMARCNILASQLLCDLSKRHPRPCARLPRLHPRLRPRLHPTHPRAHPSATPSVAAAAS